jgi:hypothetical protein
MKWTAAFLHGTGRKPTVLGLDKIRRTAEAARGSGLDFLKYSCSAGDFYHPEDAQDLNF